MQRRVFRESLFAGDILTMRGKTPREPIVTSLDSHAASLALRSLGGSWAVPRAITPLKEQRKPGHKSGVYRLHGVGAADTNVIAKRCRRESSLRERAVHEHILPRLALPLLEYYGHVDETDGEFTWLFTEDGGDETCTDEERVGLMEWLGALHTRSAHVVDDAGLSDRGSDAYLEHLRSGRARIAANLDAPHLGVGEREVLLRMLALCDVLHGHWHRIPSLCTGTPHTLVHGDLSLKNIRVRRRHSHVAYFALDWETAGRAVPAADLGSMSQTLEDPSTLRLDAYVGVVASEWSCTRHDIEMLAHAGLIFRLAASIDWATHRLPYPPGERPIRHLQSFERRLVAVMRQLGWDAVS